MMFHDVSISFLSHLLEDVVSRSALVNVLQYMPTPTKARKSEKKGMALATAQ